MVTLKSLLDKTSSLAVVGLGYVGLPLAVHLARHFHVIGFDISARRIEELQQGHDRTGELDDSVISSSGVEFTGDPQALGRARVIIVAVPTPITVHRTPDLVPVQKASETVGQHMAKGAVVVYESTVYPGVTEEICVPILEKESGLAFGRDFTVGYSPERINPGDKVNTVERIIKVVSGSDGPTLDLLAGLYGQVITAGVHKASSIKVAEAAKVIENTQRDLNIALMNELALIFDRLGIDTLEVLEAAGTKWNFIPFRPGLVGGHCIGVDPYYLTFKAEEAGYHPEVILAGRRTNDLMGRVVAQKTVKMLIAAGLNVRQTRVGVFGLTFKENVSDLRNSRVVDICDELADFGITVLVTDPHADPADAKAHYGLKLLPLEDMRELDAIILAVNHDAYKQLCPQSLKQYYANPENAVLVDVKGRWNHSQARDAGLAYWRL